MPGMANFSVINHDDGLDDDSPTSLAATVLLNYRHATALRDVAPAERVAAPMHRPHGEPSLPETVLELPDLQAVDDAETSWWSTLGNRVFWIGIVLGSVMALLLIWNPSRRAARKLDAAPTWNGHTNASVAPDNGSESTAPAESSVQAAAQARPWPSVSRKQSSGTDYPTLPPANFSQPQTAHSPLATPGQPDRAPREPVAQEPTAEPQGVEAPAGESQAFDARRNETWAAPPAMDRRDRQGELDAPPPGHESAPDFDEFGRRQPAPPTERTARGLGDTRWDGTSTDARPGEASPTGINPLVHE